MTITHESTPRKNSLTSFHHGLEPTSCKNFLTSFHQGLEPTSCKNFFIIFQRGLKPAFCATGHWPVVCLPLSHRDCHGGGEAEKT